MENLRMKMKEHPLAAAVCVMLASYAGDNLIVRISRLMPDVLLFDILHEFATMFWAFALVMICGFGRIYKQRGLRRTLFVSLPYLLLYVLLFLSQFLICLFMPGTQWLPLSSILLSVLVLFGIGFREESIFRGILVNLFAVKGLRTRRDIFTTVFFSGLLFGLIHMTNVFSGVSLQSAVFQTIGATACGFLYCAFYLRGGSLWGVVLIHMLQDGASMFEHFFTAGITTADSLNTMSAGVLVGSAIFILITLVLLRKSGCSKIIARYAQESASA